MKNNLAKRLNTTKSDVQTSDKNDKFVFFNAPCLSLS